MKRREFITLLGGAAARGRWPRAQQTERMRRIGVLLPTTADDSEFQARFGAFLQGLAQLGWIDGRNVRIDIRWAGGNADRNSQPRGRFGRARARRDPCRRCRGRGSPVQATRTVPIVFPVVGDPVGAGFVDSLARPGGNVTGFMNSEYSIGGEVAGAAQADCAGCDASCGPSRPHSTLRQRPIRRNPNRGARRSGWMSSRSTCATPVRSSAPSPLLRARRTAV